MNTGFDNQSTTQYITHNHANIAQTTDAILTVEQSLGLAGESH